MKIKNCKALGFALLSCAFIAFVQMPAMAQKRGQNLPPLKRKAKQDTAKVKGPVLPKPAADVPKPYHEVIPKTAKTSIGFFKVHEVAGKYYLEIPDTLLDRPMLTVNRISRSAADFRKPASRAVSYAGDEIGENVFSFSRGPANKLFLFSNSYKDRSADTSANGLSRALYRSNMDAIMAAFPVKAINEEGKSAVIEITDYINGDNNIFSFSTAKKALSGLATPLKDRSYVESVKAYPGNIEIKTVKTYQKQDGGLSPMMTYTFEMNSSVLLLPKTPMKVREADERMGYYSETYTDFDQNPRGVKSIGNILRWRIAPRAEDLANYHAGILVSPEKPIVIYIDPATPKKWVPWLIKGINDWQVAFEAAGFKNAIIGKEAPQNDSTWNIDDARHNVLVYKPAEQADANADIIRDPRSGEILEAHIGWYHNAMNELYKNYFIQAAVADPRAQRPQFSDELMGALIRSACSRQIGLSLSLQPNTRASSAVPVARLRDSAWLEGHGISPSIMDDNSYNYVAQPEDQVGQNALIPNIGDYDKWAIDWGYRIIPGNKNTAEENKELAKWISTKLNSAAFEFAAESKTVSDPANQQGDLGDDAMLAGSYGIKNLKKIVPNLMSWTRKPNENYDRAGEMYQALVDQFEQYMEHVANNIGGVSTMTRRSDQNGVVYHLTPVEKQERAMLFLQQELFNTPYWLKADALYKVNYTSFKPVMEVQKNILQQLLDVRTINKLLMHQSYGGGETYTPLQMLDGMKNGVFTELKTKKPVTMIRRALQKAYVLKICSMIQSAAGADGDAGTIIRAHAKALQSEIKTAAAAANDYNTRVHFQDLRDRLYLALYNPAALPQPAAKKAL